MPDTDSIDEKMLDTSRFLRDDLDEMHAFYFVDLLSHIGRLLEDNYDQRNALTRNQTRVITALLRNDGQTQTELAQCLNIHKVSAGIYVNELIEMGLVERRPHPQDGRAKCIFLTELLHQHKSGGEEIMNSIHQELRVGLSEEDYRHMLRCMRIMGTNLERLARQISPSEED